MPYVVKRRKGSRPWKIIKADINEVVGSSLTKADATASTRARYASEKYINQPSKWKVRGK